MRNRPPQMLLLLVETLDQNCDSQTSDDVLTEDWISTVDPYTHKLSTGPKISELNRLRLRWSDL